MTKLEIKHRKNGCYKVGFFSSNLVPQKTKSGKEIIYRGEVLTQQEGWVEVARFNTKNEAKIFINCKA